MHIYDQIDISGTNLLGEVDAGAVVQEAVLRIADEGAGAIGKELHPEKPVRKVALDQLEPNVITEEVPLPRGKGGERGFQLCAHRAPGTVDSRA
jgi:hypothetical protein